MNVGHLCITAAGYELVGTSTLPSKQYDHFMAVFYKYNGITKLYLCIIYIVILRRYQRVYDVVKVRESHHALST